VLLGLLVGVRVGVPVPVGLLVGVRVGVGVPVLEMVGVRVGVGVGGVGVGDGDGVGVVAAVPVVAVQMRVLISVIDCVPAPLMVMPLRVYQCVEPQQGALPRSLSTLLLAQKSVSAEMLPRQHWCGPTVVPTYSWLAVTLGAPRPVVFTVMTCAW
jgi:hypothetical protein